LPTPTLVQSRSRGRRALHSFPTRRSSDLGLHQHPTGFLSPARASGDLGEQVEGALGRAEIRQRQRGVGEHHAHQRHAGKIVPLGDRKSTRLNSSHVKISYAVFCLKKKKTK